VEGSQVTTSSPPPIGAVGHAELLLDLLLTVAHVDGSFHHRELTFAHNYIDTVLMAVEEVEGGSDERKVAVRVAYQELLRSVHQRLAQEVVALGGGVDPARMAQGLTQRAIALVRRLPDSQRAGALELALAMLHADGVLVEAERQLHVELTSAFAPPPVTPPSPVATTLPGAQPGRLVASAARPGLTVLPAHWNPLKATGHALLDPLEQTYSPHPVELQSQLAFDYQLIGHALSQLQRLRGLGQGRLAGVTDPAQLPVGAQFLDGHVHVARPSRPTELVVLGDLHGCYACLKAALLQSNFIDRAWAHQWDPERYPDVKLVLLGDYVDRGRFSFDGVLRAVLRLFVAMPDQVYVLRGNHEIYRTREGRVFSAVHPAEGLFTLVRHAPVELLEAYRLLFEELPTSLLFERTLFVHGGIPRDETTAACVRDLSGLDHPDVRFQMLWSDPVQVDEVAADVQRKSSRFEFGRRQFRAFMERIGCHTMIRGHEQFDSGFETVYDGDHKLLSLFSAGGADNRDLPEDAGYRKVRPMALTVVHDGNGARAIPWPIDYQRFNSEVHNGLHRKAPQLEYRNV